jgi:hypothetical protein
MAEYIIIVTLDAPVRLPDLDRQLILHLFHTAIGDPPNGFKLPPGVYRLFAADTNTTAVHDVVAGHMAQLRLQGAILVFEKAPDGQCWQSGHPRWGANDPQPVR